MANLMSVKSEFLLRAVGCCGTIEKIMNTITIPKKELKILIKESVREIFEQESVKFRALFMPLVSKSEQKDIEKRYAEPSRKIAKSIEVKI